MANKALRNQRSKTSASHRKSFSVFVMPESEEEASLDMFIIFENQRQYSFCGPTKAQGLFD